MTGPVADAGLGVPVARRGSGLFGALRQTGGVQRAMLVTGAVITGVFVILAVFAPLIAPYGFNDVTNKAGVRFVRLQAPSSAHWFGTTNGQGADVLSQVVYGSRTALMVVVLAVAMSLIIGVPLGLYSGYRSGWVDRVLVLITDALFAFPSLLLAIVVSIALVGGSSGEGGGILAASISITVIYIPQYFRVVRNATISAKQEPYIEAARAVGASPWTIMRRYLFGNVVQSVPIIATVNAADAILTLAGLGFLGFGIEPSSAAEWGYQLNNAQSDFASDIWWTAVFPGLAIVLLVLGLSLIGESLNDVLNPLLRARRLAQVILPGRRRNDRPSAIAPIEQAGPVLEVNDLRVWYAGAGGPIKAVDGVSFTLKRGEVLGLVGESGCGKSTLGRGLLGLMPGGAGMDGEIIFGGSNLVDLPAKGWPRIRGSGLGMIFQEPMTRLDPLMRISDHFREAIRSHEKISRRNADVRALETLRSLGIPPSRYRNFPHEFSGGMRQRIMIALALALRPAFVVADEPTTALDVLVEAQIIKILGQIRSTFSPAMLLITHNLGIVGQACDRVAVMYAGRIVEQGTVAEVFADPQHPYTRELLGATISLTTTELRTIPGAPPDLGNPPAGCRFHPRCPHAMAICATKLPMITDLPGGREVECHLLQGDSLSETEREPLVREQVLVADEA